MKKILSFLLLLSFASNILANNLFNQVSISVQNYLNTHFLNATFEFADENKTLVRGSKGIFALGGKPLHLQQEMPIASATKTLTAAAILKLQDQKLLNVKRPIGQYLTASSGVWVNNQLPKWAYQITIHHLLTHTSGLAEYIAAFKIPLDKDHPTINRLIANFAATTPVKFNPGKQYDYSSTNYVILGLIIEQITKISLNEFFTREFFKPLSMTHSRFATLSEALMMQNKPEISPYPRHYFLIPTTTLKPKFMPAKMDFVLVPYADGGIISTPVDMIKFHQALHQGKILSKKSYKLMTTPYIEIPDNMGHKTFMGYGLMITKLSNNELMYHHPGRVMGIRSECGYIPLKHLYFAVISNVMIQLPKDEFNKLDFTKIENQLDIGFFREAVINGIYAK